MRTLQMDAFGVLGVGATALIMGKAVVHAAPAQGDGTTRVDVVFSGGHDTDPRDGGRPVMLIASALGVPPEVFREAFTHVRPAPAGTRPDPAQVRRNKDALLQALRPYGVTNERLDEVSNYYRYNRSRGEMWPTTEATGYALFKQGKLSGFVVTQGGAGYSSPPNVNVPGVKENFVAQLAFSQEFDKNGAVTALGVPTGTGR